MTAGREPDPLLIAAVERAGLDTVAGAFAYDGGQDFDKPGLGGRRRTLIPLTDEAGQTHELYLKRYSRERIKRRFDRLCKCGSLCSPAEAECSNIRAVIDAGLPTMEPIVCGAERGRSFLIVTAVPGDALERCFADFLARSDAAAVEQVTRQLAGLVHALHTAGYVHRDLYASHVFLYESPAGPELYLIDLARLFSPRWRRFRWRVKDLAQLKYSMPARWVDDYWALFMETYLAGLRRTGRYEGAIDRKVAWMRRRAERKAAAKET